VDVPAARLCAQQQCTAPDNRTAAAPVLAGLHRLMQRNEGQPLQLCEADPQTRACIQDDLGYFVLGGLLPGRGSANSAFISQVRLDADGHKLHYRMSMPMRYLGIGLSCDTHDATLSVTPPLRLYITDSDHGCTWMVVGIMKASFGFEVDTVDLERGRISGWWRHRVVGTGNGRGQGYAAIQFPKALPPGDDR
jgi:hypothetical protein